LAQGVFQPPTALRQAKIKTTMIKNYFTTAIRHLLKNKGTSFINITGLALGIASLLVILVVVRYELSFDSFHAKGNHIYRLVGSGIVNGETQHGAGIVYPLAGSIKNSLTTVS
jgi:putative ABC transport system permease protein